jgi:hypothetical protein
LRESRLLSEQVCLGQLDYFAVAPTLENGRAVRRRMTAQSCAVRRLNPRKVALENEEGLNQTTSLVLTDFLKFLGKHYAIPSSLPSHLHQSAIHVAYHAHDRHLFAREMNFAAAWVSHPFHKCRGIHGHLSPV